MAILPASGTLKGTMVGLQSVLFAVSSSEPRVDPVRTTLPGI